MFVGKITFKEIKAAYYYGGRIKLNESWHAENTVCANSKLYFVLDGEIEVNAGKGFYKVGKNEMTLIPAGIRHSYRLTKANRAEKYWMHFDLSDSGENAFEGLSFSTRACATEPELVASLFETLLNHAKGDNPADAPLTSGAVALLAGYYLEKADAVKTSACQDEIESAIKAAESFSGRELNLAALANAAHLSPNYFIRKFKERKGITPVKYLNMLKLERAKSLLENTELTFSEIMNETGFYDAAYFSKVIKSNTGLSPKAFRAVYGKNR